MRYINYILLPEEQVLYSARLHPVLYVRGLVYLGLSVAVMRYLPDWLAQFPRLMGLFYQGCYYFTPLCYSLKALSLFLFGLGIWRLIQAFILIYSTELVVTDRRVIVKFGVATTTTMEMDRRKIAGIVVHQTMNGKMMNYGLVTLRGFAGQVATLPAVANPYGLQKYVTAV